MLEESKRKNIINQIITWNPEYDIHAFEKMSDNQLYAAYQNIKQKRIELINIINSIKELDNELSNLTPQFISQLSSVTLKEIINQYKTSLNSTISTQKSYKELAQQVYKDDSDQLANPYGYDDLEFLSYEELVLILGEEPSKYSYEELALSGYKLDLQSEPNQTRIKMQELEIKCLKKEIISLILNSVPKQEVKVLKKKLDKIPFEALKNMYEQYQATNTLLPEIDELKLKLKKSKA